MAHITRIKAHDPAKPKEVEADVVDSPKEEPTTVKTTDTKKLDRKAEKKAEKKIKKEQRKNAKKDKESDGKKPFILFRPFVAFGHYLRDSWRELRQVRWPNRKVTWKMVLAVFVYTAIFVTALVALDLLFDWLFGLILK